MAKPFSIRVFIEDGEPAGVRSVTKSNWDGMCIAIPRASYPANRSRLELQWPGVYILVGGSGEAARPHLYMGEGDPVQDRLNLHYAKKDFWTDVLVFISAAQRLNKAHIQHLESRLCALAVERKRCTIDNLNMPQEPSLLPADRADAELYLEEMLLVLPVLGIDAFARPEVPATDFERGLILESKGIRARAVVSTSGFVVLRGSTACHEIVPSITPGNTALRESLIGAGVLQESDGCYRFGEDYEFSSPSTAASVILGNNSNGRLAWRNRTGRTLADLEADEVQA